MDIPLRAEQELEKLRIACQLASDVLVMIEPYVKAGISTEQLNDICYDYMMNQQQVTSACLNYNGFPKATCISVNEVVCHGIPSENKILKNGDIVNIDITVIKDGYYGDTSKMFQIGEPVIRSERLCNITQQALYIGLKQIKPGVRLHNIGKAIQSYVEAQGFSVVREYCGHGIGDQFHVEPQVLHYFADDGGVVLQEGMVFTVEPMVNAGKKEVRLMNDGWTVKTKDRSYSAQYEHQIAVTSNGCEVMTIRDEEKINGLTRFLVNT